MAGQVSDREGETACSKASAVSPPSESEVHVPLHKDFYLCNPSPQFQCDEYRWGNLEAAHPVLGLRSEQDAASYRTYNNIHIDCCRGRGPPKPFQSFDETSFPQFVVDLAYELFTEDAVPFPAQAQAWPCALSGMDALLVAPTGSGKTLAYFLPSIVHMMAQPKLSDPGEGPITLVLVPTPELAQQTLQVTQRFCERTTGDDLLRAGAIYGGRDPSLQLPRQEAPDHGRWPELLVATPGRVLEFMRKNWLSLDRVSFVVVDEADLLFSAGKWLDQVRIILRRVRRGHQLLTLSATWSAAADAVVGELCPGEFVKITITPSIPSIPQDMRLMYGSRAEYTARKGELVDWLRQGCQPGESALVLCAKPTTANDIRSDRKIVDVLGDDQVGVQCGEAPAGADRPNAYERFVRGELRMLVTTFSVGARGLDYADTLAAEGDALNKLALVVVLFDFPITIMDYVHCIGRTKRPRQREGRVVAFFPEKRFWLAEELVNLIRGSGQPVPRELDELSTESKRFLASCRTAMVALASGEGLRTEPAHSSAGGAADGDGDPLASGHDFPHGSAGAAGGHGDSAAVPGTFEPSESLWILPPSLPSYKRRLLHALADEEGLPHVSVGKPPNRSLNIARTRDALPDKFFLEGERVIVKHWSSPALGGRITDPIIHPERRTVQVRLDSGRDVTPCVDEVVLPGHREGAAPNPWR